MRDGELIRRRVRVDGHPRRQGQEQRAGDPTGESGIICSPCTSKCRRKIAQEKKYNKKNVKHGTVSELIAHNLVRLLLIFNNDSRLIKPKLRLVDLHDLPTTLLPPSPKRNSKLDTSMPHQLQQLSLFRCNSLSLRTNGMRHIERRHSARHTGR